MNNNDTNLNNVPNGTPNNNLNNQNQMPPTSEPPKEENNLGSQNIQGMTLGGTPQNPINPSPIENANNQMNTNVNMTSSNPINPMGMEQNMGNPNLLNQSSVNNQEPLKDQNTAIPYNDANQSQMQPQNIGMNANMSIQEVNPPSVEPNPTVDNTNLVGTINNQGTPMGPMTIDMGNNMAPTSLSMDQNAMNNQMGIGQTPSPNQNGITDLSNSGLNNNQTVQNPNMLGPNQGSPVNNQPVTPNSNDKKKMSKTTLLLLVILLICLVGVGIYLILNKTKVNQTQGVISTKSPIIWELGKSLSTNITDYVDLKGIDASTCKLDTSKVDIDTMGSYDFSVTCGTNTQSGKIVLQDKVAPVVEVKEVEVYPGTKVNLEDFIVFCEDYTKCSYELQSGSETLEDMAAEVGVYNLSLIVSDDYDNQTTVAITLNVTEDAPVKYMRCTDFSQNTNLKAKLSVVYNYGINQNNTLTKTEKIYTYTFDDKEEYQETKNAYSPSVGIDGQTGTASFSDEDFTITLTKSLTMNDLATELNETSIPTDYSELQQYNTNVQKFTCRTKSK